MLGHGEFLGEEVRRVTAGGFVITLRKSRSASCDPNAHGHGGPNIVLPLDQGYWSDADGFEADSPIQLIYTPAGCAHRDSMMRIGGRYLCASFPFALMDGLEIRFRDPIALRRGDLARIAHALAVRTALTADGDLVVEDACWRFVSALASTSVRAGPAWLGQALSYCYDNLHHPIRVAEVGAAVGLHPAHVSRAFRETFGQSLSRHIALLRLEGAARELRSGAEPVCGIAAKFGYTDQSHLCRSLRSALGVSPSAYRRAFN